MTKTMPEDDFNHEKANAIVTKLLEACRTDKALREKLLTDPDKTLEEYGIPPMPGGMKIRFVEYDEESEMVIPLPRYRPVRDEDSGGDYTSTGKRF